MATGSGAVIERRPLLPPRVSLLTAVPVVDNGDERWANGVEWRPEPCGTGSTGTYDPCNVGTLSITAEDAAEQADVFGIWAGYKCSPFSYSNDPDYWHERALAKLLACQSRLVAHELWTGTRSTAAGFDNARLASLNSDDLSAGTAAELAPGLACLEQFLAECNCGSPGLIHATPQVATRWAADGLVKRDAGSARVYTAAMDTTVVVDAGYPGTNPAGADVATERWAYATGPVEVRLGAVFYAAETVKDSTNRDNNTIEVRAHRPASVIFDDGCCHGGIALNVAKCNIGGS